MIFSMRNRLPYIRQWQHTPVRGVMIFGMFCVMTLFFTYPLVRCISTCVPNPGDPLLNSWILAWDTHKLTTDASGFFDANIFYPYANTLAYSESQPASALLAMPVLLITQNPVLAHNWFFLFSFAVSGFGTYLLVEHLTKNVLAGVVSGMIFAFCQYKIAHFTQIQMLAEIISKASMFISFLF